MKGNFGLFFLIVIILILIFFVIFALSIGNTVGDGVMDFWHGIEKAAQGAWNFSFS